MRVIGMIHRSAFDRWYPAGREREPPDRAGSAPDGVVAYPAGVSQPEPDTPRRRPRTVLVVGAAVVLVAVVAVLLARVFGGTGGRPAAAYRPAAPLDYASSDPLAYQPGQDDRLTDAATAGEAPILYSLSPSGVPATAERVARYRSLIEQQVQGSGLDPDLVEGIVFLESGGRPDAIAGGRNVSNAAGLTQIVAQTGTDLLHMQIDVQRSQQLTDQIAQARSSGNTGRVTSLEAQRRAVDPRFDPTQAIAGTVRYLKLARDRFGREDLAVVSYHMGIGNLENAIRAYAGDSSTPIAELVKSQGLSYARLYFGSTPLEHGEAYHRLASLSDDSRNYVWKVLAAREALKLYRTPSSDPDPQAALQGAAPAGQAVLHPSAASLPQTPDKGALEGLWNDGTLQPIPNSPKLYGFRLDPTLGSGGDVDAKDLRGLQPEALAMLLYLAAGVRGVSGGKGALTVTAALTDRGSDSRLAGVGEVLAERVLHAQGWSFDISRRYGSPAQAAAFQFMLDRLQALNMIAWVREPEAIHVTVSSAARVLEPLIQSVR
jgi:soluble lytic murein transglycosylase-like protein